MTKERLLTLTWNNRLTFGLGLPALAYVGFVLSTSLLSDGAAFWGLVVVGVVY